MYYFYHSFRSQAYYGSWTSFLHLWHTLFYGFITSLQVSSKSNQPFLRYTATHSHFRSAKKRQISASRCGDVARYAPPTLRTVRVAQRTVRVAQRTVRVASRTVRVAQRTEPCESLQRGNCISQSPGSPELQETTVIDPNLIILRNSCMPMRKL